MNNQNPKKIFDLEERLIDFILIENEELIAIFAKSIVTAKSKR